MYVPTAFRATDLAVLDRLLARDPFVTLVTCAADGTPYANHVPVLWQRNGDTVLLRGHLARANPQWQHAGTALIIVHGPHGYISPGWYADTDRAARVPTWDYAVAHLYGAPQWSDAEPELSSLVAEMSARLEASVGGSWRFQPERSDHRAQLRGIVGFRLRVERMDLKLKLNQNHPRDNVVGAAQGLRAQGRADANELAAWMLEAGNDNGAH